MGHSGQLIRKTKPTSSDHLHAEDIVHSQSLGWSELAESVCVCGGDTTCLSGFIRDLPLT